MDSLSSMIFKQIAQQRRCLLENPDLSAEDLRFMIGKDLEAAEVLALGLNEMTECLRAVLEKSETKSKCFLPGTHGPAPCAPDPEVLDWSACLCGCTSRGNRCDAYQKMGRI